jgi:hypothetical protein
MCSTSMRMTKATSNNSNSCFRLSQWQSHEASAQPTVHTADASDGEPNRRLREKIDKLVLDSRTLIWLESCDVQTARSAIGLAQRIGGTVHVGESTGSHTLKAVMASEGWLGTTLSEMATRSDLIVTLGDSIRSEAPLLPARFFNSSTRTNSSHWLHITSRELPTPPTDASHPHTAQTQSPDEIICVPRENWFAWFTQLALSLQSNQPLSDSDSTNQSAKTLAHRLKSAPQTTWLWDIDELHFSTDELLIRRMLTICRLLSDTQRCSLLPLDMNVGRVTAEETLLWLTGCSTTASYAEGRWQSPTRYLGYSLEQWQRSFNTIIMVSNLPKLRSLPSLQSDLILQTQPVQSGCEFQVAAIGVTASGHLFRGDRGMVHYVPALMQSTMPTAADILTSLANQHSAGALEVFHAAGA